MSTEKPPRAPDADKAVVSVRQPDTMDPKVDVEGADFEELAKSATPEVQRLLMAVRTQIGGPRHHPLFDKFTSEHVGKFLDYAHQGEENAYRLSSSSRYFHLIYAGLFVLFLGFLIVYLLPHHKDLLAEILKLLAIFAGGFGAGFGVKSYLGKKQ